jgi:uncharacterized protein YjbI with pentapeptide repeats
MSKRSTQSIAKRGGEPLPPEPPENVAAVLPEPLDDHADYENFALADSDFEEAVAASISFRRIHFQRCGFARTELRRVEFSDVRFEACNLAGANWESAQMNRILLEDSGLVGAHFIDATFDDVVVRDANCDMTIFWKARFARVRFERCTLRRVSFEGADLTGVIFSECDLAGADLRGAKLAGTDFRGSRIDGISAEARDLRGAIISPDQAVEVVGLFGVTVKWEGEGEGEA